MTGCKERAGRGGATDLDTGLGGGPRPEAKGTRRKGEVLVEPGAEVWAVANFAGAERGDDHRTLRRQVDDTTIWIAAALARVPVSAMTVNVFWHTLARRGAWLGRKNDPRPGWKCIWRGWYDVSLMALGASFSASG